MRKTRPKFSFYATRKKIGFFILVLSSFLAAFCLIWIKTFFSSCPSGYCPFCDKTVLDRQKFYEDAEIIALCTHKPITPGHCLVIPKRHVERFECLTDAEVVAIGKTIRKVNKAAQSAFDASTYLLLQKNGKEVGQSVPHLHFHYIPRKEGESSVVGFVFKIGLAEAKPPLSSDKMDETVCKIRESMER